MNIVEFTYRYGPSLFLAPRAAQYIQTALKGLEGFPPGGSGPGGGVPATPKAITFFLTAVLAGGPRTQVRERMWNYFNLTPEGTTFAAWEGEPINRPKCSLTDQVFFGHALHKLLSDPDLAARVVEVSVVQQWHEAEIRYRTDDGRDDISQFVDVPNRSIATRAALTGHVRTTCTIGGNLIRLIAEDLQRERAKPPTDAVMEPWPVDEVERLLAQDAQNEDSKS